MKSNKQGQSKKKKNGGSMKKQILAMLVILSLGVTVNIFAQELQVEGDLQVQGTIDATNNRVTNVAEPVDENDAVNTIFLRNSVQDNGPWEFKMVTVRLSYYSNSSNMIAYYKTISSGNWANGFESYLNGLALEGWYVDKIIDVYHRGGSSSNDNLTYIHYLLKRKIVEE